jgi:cyclase
MLKKRIIPTLLLKDGMLVKGERFNSWRKIGPVLPMIRVYENREVDELISIRGEK